MSQTVARVYDYKQIDDKKEITLETLQINSKYYEYNCDSIFITRVKLTNGTTANCKSTMSKICNFCNYYTFNLDLPNNIQLENIDTFYIQKKYISFPDSVQIVKAINNLLKYPQPTQWCFGNVKNHGKENGLNTFITIASKKPFYSIFNFASTYAVTGLIMGNDTVKFDPIGLFNHDFMKRNTILLDRQNNKNKITKLILAQGHFCMFNYDSLFITACGNCSGDYINSTFTIDACTENELFADLLNNNSLEINSSMVSIYPNPAQSLLTIELNCKLISLKLFNNLSQECNYKILGNTSNTIDLDISNLKTGVYTIQINGKSTKFVKN